MLNIPENIRNMYLSDNLREETQKKLKLRFYDHVESLYPHDTLFPDDALYPADQEPWLTIGNDKIDQESLLIEEFLCEEEDLVFGMCTTGKCEIMVADLLEDISGKEFLLSIELGGYEMTMGIFRVESVVRQSERRMKKITGYDRMRQFHVDVAAWYQSLIFPLTLRSLRDSLCQQIGVEQVQQELPLDNMMVEKTVEPEVLSGLDVLKAICEINGVFGHFEHTGYLKYMSLAITSLWPSEELYPDDDILPSEATGFEVVPYYKRLEYEDYLVRPIDALQIRQEDGDVGTFYGDGSNCYTIEANFLLFGKGATELAEIARIIYDAIAERTYRPCSVECPAMPWVEVGDGFLVHTKSDVIESFVLSRTIKGIQAMMDTFEAAGNESREQRITVNTAIKRLQGKTAVIKKSVEEVSVKVSDLKEFTEAQLKIVSNEILAEVKRASEAEAALSVKADQISLSVKDLKEFTEAQFEVTAKQILAKVSKGEVSSELSMEPGAITLKTNRLSWESDKSSMSSDGKLICQEIEAINGRFSGTLESDVFYAGDDGVAFGDYRVSASGSNILESINGYVKFDCRDRPSGSPGGRCASLFLGGEGYAGIELIGTGGIRCGDIKCGDVIINDSWTEGMTLLEMLKDLYNRANIIKDRVDDLENSF